MTEEGAAAAAAAEGDETPEVEAAAEEAEEASGDEPALVEGEGETEEAEAPVEVAPTGLPEGRVELNVDYVGVGRMHRSFFGDTRLLEGLGDSLSGKIRSPATMQVTVDGGRGEIALLVESDSLGRNPISSPGEVELGLLTPLTVALADYRQEVAGAFDFRVESFEVRVAMVGGQEWCSLIAEGAHPPNGEQLSPCMKVGEEELCGVERGGRLRFTADVASRVEACL